VKRQDALPYEKSCSAYDLPVSSVSIVLHGIGDPTTADILDQAQRGLHSAFARDSQFCEVDRRGLQKLPLAFSRNSYEVERAAFEELPSLDGINNSDALIVRTQRAVHIIIPVVWARLRKRAAPAFLGDVEGLVAFDLSGLWEIARDTLACARLGSGPVWKMGLKVAAWLMYALVILFVLACLLAAIAVMWGFRLVIWAAVVSAFPINSTFMAYLADLVGDVISGIVFFTPLLLLFYYGQARLGRVLPLYDLCGDVAFYVKNAEQRAIVEGHLRQILESVTTSFSSADVLLVTHSLGSVVASHCLLKSGNSLAKAKLTLVTLGSPIRKMSRIFKSVVSCPEELVARYMVNSVPKRWVNLWRDFDIIGTSLFKRAPGLVSEKSLGIGGHRNYWSDARLWYEMAELLQSVEVTRSEEADQLHAK